MFNRINFFNAFKVYKYVACFVKRNYLVIIIHIVMLNVSLKKASSFAETKSEK